MNSILCFTFLLISSNFIYIRAEFPHPNQNYFNSSLDTEFHENGGEGVQSSNNHRSSKLFISSVFPLFSIVRFNSDPCLTTTKERGTCYTKQKCSSLGGVGEGPCAQGLGVCCQFQVTCGGLVTQNSTFFRNPNFPSKYKPASGSDVCQVRIRKQQNICQLRINFIKFEIDGPVTTTPAIKEPTAKDAMNPIDTGMCKTDALTITSSDATVPSICGGNSGQHVYTEFGSSDTASLNILLSSNAVLEREWNIEVLQIPCRSEARAPSGCLQYFEGVAGEVKSFNFENKTHLSNMDYSICVRREEGMKSIEWTACKKGQVKVSSLPPEKQELMKDPPCDNKNDYLQILGGIFYPRPTDTPLPTSGGDRFCDVHFEYSNSLVRSSVRPFMLRFKTDGEEKPVLKDDGIQGFCLKWQQSPQLI